MNCRTCNTLIDETNRSESHTSKAGTIFYKNICRACHADLCRKRYHLHKSSPPKPDSNYKCPICLRSGRRLNLDHDWDTNSFRGWLCNTCNNALGHLMDDIVVLQRAIDYLEKTKGIKSNP